MYANFSNARAYSLHGFPVCRLRALLDLPKLMAGFRSSQIRERLDSGEAVAKEDDRFHKWGCIEFDTFEQVGRLPSQVRNISFVIGSGRPGLLLFVKRAIAVKSASSVVLPEDFGDTCIFIEYSGLFFALGIVRCHAAWKRSRKTDQMEIIACVTVPDIRRGLVNVLLSKILQNNVDMTGAANSIRASQNGRLI